VPTRRRFATRAELVEHLARREPDVDWPRAVEALEAEGVLVEHLVRVSVDEEV